MARQTLASVFTQVFPPKPKFTEKDVQDLNGQVYIITGANAGVGKELARMLYYKNAKVYIAARSEERAKIAIEEIKKTSPDSTGTLVFFKLDLNDLATIKGSVQQFLNSETKLHVLFNNAGIQSPQTSISRTVQGYESHLGVNTIGTFLFTKLLTPILVTTARSEPKSTVRVVWVSSSGAEIFAEQSIGVSLDNLDYHKDTPPIQRYGISKVGNWAHGVEFAKRYAADGVVSVPLNPGNLSSELYRDRGILFKLATWLILYPSINGAYTELFAGLSPLITLEKTGCWVIPFGRIYPIREDMVDATRIESEGGSGGTHKFWEWTEEQVKPYI